MTTTNDNENGTGTIWLDEERVNRATQHYDHLDVDYHLYFHSNSPDITSDDSAWHPSNISPRDVMRTMEPGEYEQSSDVYDGRELDGQSFHIPDNHLTTTGSLFSLACIQRLIGEYPENFFYQIEATRSAQLQDKLNALDLNINSLDLNQKTLDILLESFFANIHIHFPIVDPDLFRLFFYRDYA